MKEIRQGDVLLRPVQSMPKGPRKAINPENGTRFVLAHGEVTGHAHAIYEYTNDQAAEDAIKAIQEADASAKATEAINKAKQARYVQLWEGSDGEWYLEVSKPAQMRHEEHSAPTIPAGFYRCPIQVQETTGNMPRRVAD